MQGIGYAPGRGPEEEEVEVAVTVGTEPSETEVVDEESDVIEMGFLESILPALEEGLQEVNSPAEAAIVLRELADILEGAEDLQEDDSEVV